MNDINLIQSNLPATIEDLSKFVLVGREKLSSVRAEIRAIDKLQLAQEVRDQKRDEARMLSEALLDAEVRLGELFKALPKAPGARTDIKPIDTTVERFQGVKPKHEVIQELGFHSKQAERFEILADNQDLVEQVKAEARENDDLPTRTQVISLAKARQAQYQKQDHQIDQDYECAKVFNNFYSSMVPLKADAEFLSAVLRAKGISKSQNLDYLDDLITEADEGISKLTGIKSYYISVKAKGGFHE